MINPIEWRISKSGFSIKTGWGDEKKIIAKCPVDSFHVLGWEKIYSQWLKDAAVICDLYNANLNKSFGDKLAANKKPLDHNNQEA